MKFKKTRHDMKCKKCGEIFLNANSWHLCYDCYVDYEDQIPEHIPQEQYTKYLFKTIKEIHEL